MPTRKTATPTSTIAPTPTSCLYVRSTRPPSLFPRSLICLDDGHLQIALQELLHDGVFGRDDLFSGADGANLGLGQQRDPVGDAKRPAHVVGDDDAGHPDLLLQPL